jgi:hypothetical protein
MNGWLIAVLPLIGVIVGAALQHVLGRTAEKERQVYTLRTAAYVDYLRAVAAAGHLRSDEDLRDAHRDAADAKSRIAVYGSAKVVHALAQFEEAGAVLDNACAYNAFIQLVAAMRPWGESLSLRDIELVLFGPERRGNHVQHRLPA